MSEVDAGVREAIGRLGRLYALGPGQEDRLVALLEALAEERDPPTTLQAPSDAVTGHLADSLAALELDVIRRARGVADIGSGAGFPGLVLAVVLPNATVDLIEASRRKCEVIRRLAAAAAIENARPRAVRAETWAAGEGRNRYEVVTARAVAALPVLAEYAAPLLRRGGSLVAWKGRRDSAEERAGEVAAGRLGLERHEVVPVAPFAEARERHLHVLQKEEPTPAEFPRAPGRAAKRPLA